MPATESGLPSARSPGRTLLAALLLLLLLAGHAYRNYGFVRGPGTTTLAGQRYSLISDDQMITMLYARNLVERGELVWNPGERVEGFSNPGTAALMALLWAALRDQFACGRGVQLLALALSLATLVLCWALARGGGLAAAGAASGAYLLAPDHIYYSLAGFENYALGFGAALLLNLLYRYTGPTAARPPSARLAALYGLGLGLIAVTHLSGFVVAAALLLAAIVAGWRTPRGGRLLGLCLLTAAVLPLAYEVFRLTYYGDLLPNTYYLKVAVGAHLRGGVLYVGRFFENYAAVVLPALIGLLALQRTRPAFAWALAAYGGVVVVAVVAMGGDTYHGWRFLFPLVPVLCALFGRGLGEALEPRRHGSGVLSWGVVMAALAVVWLSFRPATGRLTRETAGAQVWNERHICMGLILDSLAAPNDTLAVFHAGFTPFFSHRRNLDMLGKTERHISHRPPHPGEAIGHEKDDPDYVLATRPRFVECGVPPESLNSVAVVEDDPWQYPKRLVANPQFRRLYAGRPVWYQGGGTPPERIFTDFYALDGPLVVTNGVLGADWSKLKH